MGDIHKKTLAELDASLLSFQTSLSKLASLLEQSIDNASPATYFLDLIKGSESISKTIEKLVILAPYLIFRNDFEAVERVKEWLLSSTQFIGEKRFEMIRMLTEYQEILIARTETPTQHQMTLL